MMLRRRVALSPLLRSSALSSAAPRRFIAIAPDPNPSPDPTQPPSSSSSSRSDRYDSAISSGLSTFAGIALLAGAGLAYHKWYKWEVLRKMGRAFGEGYDPVMELANAAALDAEGRKRPSGHIQREEQGFMDELMEGRELPGEYLLLLGPKGAGKTTLVVEALLKNGADGAAMVEAHEDPEVFRLRLGKALDFEYSEDSFAGLFQRKDPREAGPLLDIERCLAKLEKVAIKYRKERGRPLVLVFNNIHFIHDDPEGHSLLHMLQQRAESWAAAGVLTTVFSSDDFAPYRHLKKNASRMHVLRVRDLTPAETHAVLARARATHFPFEEPLDPEVSMKVWDLVGGRLSFLSKLARQKDVMKAAEEKVESEKRWLLGRLGLIPDLDDDVMDEQKVSSCSMLLFQEFARLADEAEEENQAALAAVATRLRLLPPIVADDASLDAYDLPYMLPAHDVALDYRRTREVMTRPDYVQDLDHHNILHIDEEHFVRPDSRLMLSVFRSIAAEPDFEDKLSNVRDRVDEIESLHRTSELTVKGPPADLGGFLRIRVGKLEKEHEGGDAGEDDGGRQV
ncbi:hypothetical protein RQP46_007903 [Phenoliferia psychrophenolica]